VTPAGCGDLPRVRHAGRPDERRDLALHEVVDTPPADPVEQADEPGGLEAQDDEHPMPLVASRMDVVSPRRFGTPMR